MPTAKEIQAIVHALSLARVNIRKIRLLLESRLPSELAMAIIDFAGLRDIYSIEGGAKLPDTHPLIVRAKTTWDREAFCSAYVPASGPEADVDVRMIEFWVKPYNYDFGLNTENRQPDVDEISQFWTTGFDVDVRLLHGLDWPQAGPTRLFQGPHVATIRIVRLEKGCEVVKTRQIIWRNVENAKSNVAVAFMGLRRGGTVELVPVANGPWVHLVLAARISDWISIRW